jgi:hypothetical protein
MVQARLNGRKPERGRGKSAISDRSTFNHYLFSPPCQVGKIIHYIFEVYILKTPVKNKYRSCMLLSSYDGNLAAKAEYKSTMFFVMIMCQNCGMR